MKSIISLFIIFTINYNCFAQVRFIETWLYNYPQNNGIGVMPTQSSTINGLTLCLFPGSDDNIKSNGMVLDLNPITFLALLYAPLLYKTNFEYQECDSMSILIENKVNGAVFSVVGFGRNSLQVNGANIGVWRTETINMNGFSLSVVSNTNDFGNGLMISALNSSYQYSGIMIGLINYSRKYKGIQIGLLNIIDGWGLPLINFRI